MALAAAATTRRLGRRAALAFAAALAGCSNQPVNVTYEGFACPTVPGLDEFLEAADANNDNRISSDEFNGAFEEAMDDVTPDGQLDRQELANYVCQKKRAKAAAGAAPPAEP